MFGCENPGHCLSLAIPFMFHILNGSVFTAGDERAALPRTTSRLLVSKKFAWNVTECRRRVGGG